MEDATRELLSGSRLRIERVRARKLQASAPTGAVEKLADEKIKAAQEQGQLQELEGAGKPQETRMPVTARTVRSIADQRIEAAMRDGEFDNLEGMGKPLDLYDDAHIPADLRLSYRMMKGKGLETPWQDATITYKQKRALYETWLMNNRATWEYSAPVLQQKLLQELAERIKNLNDLIHTINATVPNDTMRLGLLVFKREQQRLEGRM